ncbi:MAG: UrcA family protein [Caulobacterales bacterium]|nr:UrcA family protein [Caulobacterales bacterium]
MKTTIAIAAAIFTVTVGFALPTSQALAQEEGPMKVAVSYADLDLSAPKGRAVLQQRIEHAIDQVCPARPLPTELAKQQGYRACHSSAWAGAKQQLAAIYDGRQLADASVRIGGVRH